MSSLYDLLEAAMVERLAPLASEAKIIVSPDSIQALQQANLTNTLVVRFVAEEKDATTTQIPPRIKRQLRRGRLIIEIRMYSSELRTHQGAYPLLEKATDRLEAWAPTFTSTTREFQADPAGMQHERTSFVAALEDLWEWASVYSLPGNFTKLTE